MSNVAKEYYESSKLAQYPFEVGVAVAIALGEGRE
jgi:hypothetical protein